MGLEILLTQWDYEKNGTLTPDRVTYGSHAKAWCRCEKGHSWQAIVKSRISGCGCPVCGMRLLVPGVNDLATLEPEIAAEWYEALNAPLTPEMVTVGSHRKVWWECSEGHVWKSVIYSRTGAQRCGCPVCAGKVKIKHMYRYEKILEKV